MSFRDHFPGSSLDSRWTSVTAGSGSVTVSDSNARIQSPSADNYGYIYYNTELDKSTDQVWWICAKVDNSAGWRRKFMVRNTSTPGTGLVYDSDAATVLQAQLALSTNYYLLLEYYDDVSGRQIWDESAGSWVSSPVFGADNRLALDDYAIIGFEFDATGDRFRLFAYCLRQGTYSQDQGLKLFQLTDWVDWSDAQTAQDDLYLSLGSPFTNFHNNTDHYYEFVWMDDGAKSDAYYSGRANGSTPYSIRHIYKRDYWYLPPDKSDLIVAGAGGQWDDDRVKDPMCVHVGSTYYLYYSGHDGSNFQIGLATASDPAGAYTKSGSNPVITRSAGHEDHVFTPYVVYDDVSQIFHMLYVGFSSTDSKWRIYYATSSDGTSWNKHGIVLSPGAASDFDEDGCSNPVFFWWNNQWEVWYSGSSPDPTTSEVTWQTGRATGQDLTSLTKDGSGARITWQADGQQDATAAISGRTISMSDTSGFMAEATVIVSVDSDAENWSISKIRKINVDTSLELYHGLDFASGGKIVQVDAFRGQYLRYIEKVGSTWYFWGTAFRPYVPFASFDSNIETIALWTHTGTDPADSTPAISVGTHPDAPLTGFGFDVSSENIGPVTEPISVQIVGEVTWGHDTGVIEANIRDFIVNWAGTGAISGAGDAETLDLETTENMVSEVVNTGAVDVELLQNNYDGSGDNVDLDYRHGATDAACRVAAWNNYTVPFTSLGFVQIRMTSTL